METSASPISSSSGRDLPMFVSRSHSSGLNLGRELVKSTPSKQALSSPGGRHGYGDDAGNNLASAKHLQRTITPEKRKDAARRRLLGTMYSKQNDVNRSFSFVAGERPKAELLFPSVSVTCYKNKNIESRYGPDNTSNTHLPFKDRPLLDINKNKKEHLFYKRKKPSSESKGRKISLPEIIMEFNLEASMSANDRDLALSHEDVEEEERALGVSYEEFLSQPKYVAHNPCRSKYRPVTPGLLDSLNKSKVPSKVKTEQWVKSIQTTRKSYCGSSYKFGNLDNSNLAVPNWIYEYR